MRIMLAVSLLVLSASIAGCSGSGGPAAAPERTEETQAANVLFGLADQAISPRVWTEQTATSPAVFKVHMEGNDGQPDESFSTYTVTKAGKCKYQTRIERTTKPLAPFTLDVIKDLSGVDVDKAPPINIYSGVASVPGLSGSCTVTAGNTQFCDKDKMGGDPTILPFPFPLTHEKNLIKAFKAKFCQ